MPTHNVYVLSERTRKYMSAMGFQLTCFKCKQEIKVGEELVSMRAVVRKKPVDPSEKRFFHVKCWESLSV